MRLRHEPPAMDDGVVVDPPPTNRWALAGLAVSGGVAGTSVFAVPALAAALGLSLAAMVALLGAIHATAGAASVYFLVHLHPQDAAVERY
jgi:hypothetical protein